METIKKYFALLTGLLVFIIYLFTLAPTVIQIDSGELAAVQALPGIAHPTGYPLFTILGYIFSLLPLPFEMIYQLNLLAAIYCSIGTGIFVYTSKVVLDNIVQFKPAMKTKNELKRKKRKKEKKKEEIEKENKNEIPDKVKFIASILGGFILAFSQTYWFQSTSVEVYSLHILLINLIILFLIKAYLSGDEPGEIKLKSLWIAFAIFLALGFTNHMTTLLIIPGVAYLYFMRYKFFKTALKRIVFMILIFIPVLAVVYSYLPLMASANPVINWSNPDNFEKLMRHVSGQQYQVWLFGSTEAAKENFIYFFNNLTSEFSVSLLFGVVGLFASFIMARRFFVFLIVSFLVTIFYSINYDIVDLDSYFLLAYISIAFFSVFGIIQIVKLLNQNKINTLIGTLILTLIIAVQFYVNFDDVNQSDTYTFEDYTKELLASTEENSIILSYQWDYFISPSYYFQFIKDFRRDIKIVDKELLRRSWYYNQLSTAYPGLLDGLKEEVNQFNEAVKPFERGEDYNANVLERAYRNIMERLITANSNSTFYLGPEMFEQEMQRGEFTLPPGYTLVPDIFLFKVVKGNEYVPADDPDFTIRIPENKNRYINIIESYTASMLVRRAMYEIQFNNIDRAKVYVEKIKKDFPDFRLPPGLEELLTP